MPVILGTACLAAAGVTAYLAPQCTRYLAPVWLNRTLRSSRSLVLTYDDGPGPELTPMLAGMLQDAGARATFFLLGSRMRGNESILDRLAEAGHELACHGQDHVHAWKSSPLRAVRDMNLGYQSLARWVPPDATFRPPFGKLTLATWLAIQRRGARTGWWTIDSGDTHAELPPAQSIADRLARAGGGVVLLHDFDRSAPRRQFVLRTTELLLQTAHREGMTVCRYVDLFSRDRADVDSASPVGIAAR